MGFLDWLKGGGAAAGEPPVPKTPPVPTETDILRALDETEQLGRDAKLHPVVIARIGRVSRVLRETLPRIRESAAMASTDSYAVMATATDYLPEALGAYLRLPRDWADSRPIENGKTSLMLLIDQLDLLGSTMDKIFDAVVRRDADALIAHGRFLTAKFGHESTAGELDLHAGARPLDAPARPEASPPAHRPASSAPANPLDLP